MLYITLEEEYVKVPLCEVVGAYDGTVGINVGAKETSRFIAYVNIIVLLYLVACKYMFQIRWFSLSKYGSAI